MSCVNCENISEKHTTPEAWWSSLEFKAAFATACTLPLLLSMVIAAPFLHDPLVQFFISTPVVILGFAHFGISGLKSLGQLKPNMDVLVTIGIASAYVYSILSFQEGKGHEYMYFETAASIVMYVLIGNLIEHRAVAKTTSAVEELGRLKPAKARKITGEDSAIEIDAESIRTDDILAVVSGDSIPVDGIITRGEALIDESMITGESLPIEKITGNTVIGGSVLTNGSIQIRATATGEATILSEIIRLVTAAQSNKPSIQRIGDSVSAVFVPMVLLFAIGAFIANLFWFEAHFNDALLRAVAVLVVACPCAMGLATPTAIMVGVGRAAKRGILFKGGDTVEGLSRAKSMIFDKTGTITTGSFLIKKIDALTEEREKLKSIVRSLEEHSNHPIAISLRSALKDVRPIALNDVRETKGLGIEGRDAEGNQWALGSKSLLKSEPHNEGYDLYVLKNGLVAGGITIEDELKPDAAEIISTLNNQRLYTALLSGDSERKCKLAANRIPFREYMSERKPHEKLQEIRRLEEFGSVAYVGDGINDGPALTTATVGIALGKASAVAIQSANVVLMSEDLHKTVEAYMLARATVRVIKQNLFWAFFYNILMIPLAAIGTLTPGFAALAMALSDVFVIGNSLRLKFIPVRTK